MKSRFLYIFLLVTICLPVNAQLRFAVDSIHLNSQYSREHPYWYAPIVTIEGWLINDGDESQYLFISELNTSNNTETRYEQHFLLKCENIETDLVYYRSECYPCYLREKGSWEILPNTSINPKDSAYVVVNGMILLEERFSEYRNMKVTNCKNPGKWRRCGAKLSRIVRKMDFNKCNIIPELRLDEGFEPLVLD